MPYVMVDTNCLMRDYLLIGANMQTFLRGCQRCHIMVCFPDVVIDELVSNYEKDIKRLTNEHRSIKNHQLSWWFDGEPLKAVSKDSATFGMGLWDH